MQFSLPPEYTGEPSLRISGGDYHYLKHVLRLGAGDNLTARDRTGRLCRIVIRREERDQLICDVEQTENAEAVDRQAGRATGVTRGASSSTGPVCPITLYQCLPKGQKMDHIIRQVTELGIARIIPVVSERVIGRMHDPDRVGAKLARWRRIAESALRQSGAKTLPLIDRPLPLGSLPFETEACNLYLHPERSTGGNLHARLAERPGRIGLVVGPEGGFSTAEVRYLNKKAIYPIFLGSTTLRVETAAVSAVAVVKLLLLEQDYWTAK